MIVLNVPNRAEWHRVNAGNGTAWNDREKWCRDNCQGRWIQMDGSKITEFEDSRDAVLFALMWS